MTDRQCYLIDSAARTITARPYSVTEDIHDLIGGYLEMAWASPSGDVLYVDEDGFRKAPRYLFAVPTVRPDQPFAGNGVLVGPEAEGEQYPEGYTTLAPTLSIEDLRAMVVWVA